MSGRLTADAMIEIVRAARADPRWSNDYDFLTIITDASLADVSAEDTAGIVQALGQLDTPRADGKAKRAAVVCSDEMAAGLLSYYEFSSITERATDERYFMTERQARAWLAGEPSEGEHQASPKSA